MLCERCQGNHFVLKKVLGLLCSVPCPCCAMTGTVGDDGPAFEDPEVLARRASGPTAVGPLARRGEEVAGGL
jgi:hypothetical protein